MKNHLYAPKSIFENGYTRSRAMVDIFNYLKMISPASTDYDDILRSALILAVSALDKLIHDVYRAEVGSRLIEKKNVRNFRVSFEVTYLEAQAAQKRVDELVTEENSYKSFVAPDKLAECLKGLVDEPWESLAKKLSMPTEKCKSTLKDIIKLRNRIAHEADVNPDLAGIELWKIYKEDVLSSIEFLNMLGLAVIDVIDKS